MRARSRKSQPAARELASSVGDGFATTRHIENFRQKHKGDDLRDGVPEAEERFVTLTIMGTCSPQIRHNAKKSERDNGGFLRVTEDWIFVAKTARMSRFFP